MRLLLMRHAQAGMAPGDPDHARPLTVSGLHEAEAAGRWLREHQLAPDLILCSDARRVLETVAALEFHHVETYAEHELYLAPAEAVLERVRAVDGFRQVLVVGHNPGLHQLVVQLAGTPAHMESGLPTGAVALVDPGAESWAELQPDSTELLDTFRP